MYLQTCGFRESFLLVYSYSASEQFCGSGLHTVVLHANKNLSITKHIQISNNQSGCGNILAREMMNSLGEHSPFLRLICNTKRDTLHAHDLLCFMQNSLSTTSPYSALLPKTVHWSRIMILLNGAVSALSRVIREPSTNSIHHHWKASWVNLNATHSKELIRLEDVHFLCKGV